MPSCRGRAAAIDPERWRRRAHKLAWASAPAMGALHDRIYSTAIMCASKQPDRIAAAMFVRAAICLEALHEMRGWPAGKVAGITG
jgi:hypothetical protein